MDISDWPQNAMDHWSTPGAPDWDPCTITAAFRGIDNPDLHFVAHFTGPTLECAQALVRQFAEDAKFELVKARINSDQSAVVRFKKELQFSLDHGYWPGDKPTEQQQ